MDEDEGTAPAGTDAPAGGGKHKHGKLGIFAGKHRDEILVISSVLLVVLAWLSLRKTSSSATAASGAGYLSPTSAAQAGLAGSGAVGGYSAAAQQGLQTLLANQSDQLSTLESAVTNLTGSGSSTPTSIASSLSSPLPSGALLNFAGDGALEQVQSDGSLYHLNPAEWAGLQSRGATYGQILNVGGNAPTDYSATSNLLRQVKAANPGWTAPAS